ncbi:AraC family transcriptional regulator [Bacteroides sp. 214]|uniref:helix-turn-helix domain-containing protein n=1 Tax=Bacteroides sp. 214 TaxID=2302935 RepID=UPI0013D89837|nr:AraC family transcriptional regulator [Bacteroides sp. 214]NDW12642.1 AraC family transcriptional regulator [Bacteroides sp. 214]
MKKYVKVPTALINDAACQSTLLLDGCSVIESCVHTLNGTGTMFLEEHLLFLVLEGQFIMHHGKQTYTVNKNEMILLKKATSVKYEKTGDPDNDNISECIMFCLKDDLIKEFLTMANVKIPRTEEEIKTSVYPMDDCLIAFGRSLDPYFKCPTSVDPGLLRLKIMELLYDISLSNKNMFIQLLQFRQPARMDIRKVVEQYYATPVTLPELAYLSGRSLSSFKRDFQLLYNMPPARWIKEKRLEKAREMIQNTAIPVNEIGYSIGFENISHFSRIFKEYYGQSPTDCRQPIKLD